MIKPDVQPCEQKPKWPYVNHTKVYVGSFMYLGKQNDVYLCVTKRFKYESYIVVIAGAGCEHRWTYFNWNDPSMHAPLTPRYEMAALMTRMML